jgi:hypothetical protein
MSLGAGSWRDRSFGEALSHGRPMTAFVDEDGTFWPPCVSNVVAYGGQPYVPYEDFQEVAALLEAALRRERGGR